jgi:ketol-acid reductoisomerase
MQSWRDAAQLADDQTQLRPAMLRALQEAVSAAEKTRVTYVATPDELQTALSAGARHIEITEHLELTFFETFNSVYGLVKLQANASTWSIRVRVFSLVMSQVFSE